MIRNCKRTEKETVRGLETNKWTQNTERNMDLEPRKDVWRLERGFEPSIKNWALMKRTGN